MKKNTLIFCVIILLTVSCTSKRDNPFDIHSNNYIAPSFTIDWAGSNISQNSIITKDSIYLSLIGNTEYNEFRHSMDNTYWHPWSTVSAIREQYIDDGMHSLFIESRYANSSDVSRDTVKFTAAILPASAVYIYPWKQYTSVGDTASITICTKNISGVYMMHCQIRGATIVKDSLLYTTSANASVLSSDSVADIAVLNDSTPISGSIPVIALSIANVNLTGKIDFSCVLRDKNNNTVSSETVRGCYILQSATVRKNVTTP